MKFFSFLLSVLLILSFSVTAFADEVLEPLPDLERQPEVQEEAQNPTNNDFLDIVLNGMQNQISDLNEKVEVLEDDINSLSESGTLPDSTTSEPITEEGEEFNPDTDLPVDIMLYSVAPITPESTEGLKSVILSVIGDYDPVVVEYRYQNSNQTSYQYLREVMPDYPWCASFIMLSLFVYCVFRLGGALIG